MKSYLPVLVVLSLVPVLLYLTYPLWANYLDLFNPQYLFCGFVGLSGLGSLAVAKVGVKQRQQGFLNLHVRRGYLERLVFALAGLVLLGLSVGFGAYLTLIL